MVLKTTINKEIINDYYSSTNLPFSIDINQDGLNDVEITGNAQLSGSNGAKNELYIQGINGSQIFYQTKQDTSWTVDVFTGSYDTVYNYNNFLQPTAFYNGDEINTQLNRTNSQLTIYHKHNKGSMNIPSSNINRTDLVNGNFQYYGVITPSGLHWIKIKPGIPTTILQSYSTIGVSSNLIIVDY